MTVLSQVVSLWERQFHFAKKTKHRVFGRTSRALRDYYGSPETVLPVVPENEDYPADMDVLIADGTSSRSARLNKAAEFVALMMPYIFAQVPKRTVTQRFGQLPPVLAQIAGQSQMLAGERAAAPLLEWVLNWLPKETGLARETRSALPDALVSGMGVLWHSLADTSQGILPTSDFLPIDRLVFDADARSQKEAGFIFRVQKHAAWRLADTYQMPVERFREAQTNTASNNFRAQAASSIDDDIDDFARPTDEKGDIVTYFEVYSRVGLGFQLPTAPASDDLNEGGDNPEAIQNLAAAVQATGPYIRLVIVPGIPYPINLPPEIMTGTGAIEQIKAALEWPIPYHEDRFSPWPFSDCVFYPEATNPYGISPLRGAFPLLRFKDNVFSWAMNRIRRSCRDLIITSKELKKEVEDAIANGQDFEMVGTDGQAVDVEKLIHVVQFPEIKRDVPEVLAMADRAFEDSTGMTPLMYGTTNRAMRSATEAGIVQSHTTSRPDDYAECVTAWHSDIARKEAIATRLYMSPKTIAGIFREPDPELAQAAGQQWGPFSQIFAQFVATPDATRANAEWAYQVEAGGSRRKNQQKLIEDLHQIVPVLAPILSPFAIAGLQSGQMALIEPLNGLIETIGRALDTSLDKLKIPPVALPPPEEEGGGKEKSSA